eukprot:3292847-Rhodomonas_salina.1
MNWERRMQCKSVPVSSKLPASLVFAPASEQHSPQPAALQLSPTVPCGTVLREPAEPRSAEEQV